MVPNTPAQHVFTGDGVLGSTTIVDHKKQRFASSQVTV